MDLRRDPAVDTVDLDLLTEAQRYVWLLRPDLRRTAGGAGLANIGDFLYWWYTRGVIEYPSFAEPPGAEQYRALAAPAYPAAPQTPPISHFLARIWREREDLRTVYPLDKPAGRRGFVEWILAFGRREVPIQDLWIDQGLRDWLLSPDPELPPAPRIALDLWKARPDLQKAYNLDDADDRQGLREWLWAYGTAEHQLAWLLDEPPDPATYIPPASRSKDARKRCPPPTRDEGVNLIGFATAEFGLGEDLRMAAKALTAAGVPFSVFEVPAGPGVGRRDLSVSRWLSNDMPHRTSILCMAAFEAADFYLRYGKEAFAERFVIGYWPWELPRWPALWAGVFDLVDEVWASSRYTQAAFAAASSVPVLHMPMAVELPRAEPQPRARFALRDGVFQFLLVFDWHSWPARKNPSAAIAAFRLAFPLGSEPVGLAIKMIGTEPWSAEFAAFRALADADPRITLLPGTLDRSALTALYRCCDAYLSLHRAEGFGRTMAEAMLMGKPVVATNWSGNIDFIDGDTGCPVEFSLLPVERGDYPYADGQVWAEPDVYSAAEWLRWLAADWSRAAKLGRAGRARIVEQFSTATVGARYAERLNALWRPTAQQAAPGPQPAAPARRKAKAPA
jgi:glycosyltransferase involved in cell wall biosynthesis